MQTRAKQTHQTYNFLVVHRQGLCLILEPKRKNEVIVGEHNLEMWNEHMKTHPILSNSQTIRCLELPSQTNQLVRGEGIRT